MKNATIRYAIASNIERIMLATPDLHTELELAGRTRIQQSVVRAILSASIDVDVDTLDLIAKALNVSASALLANPSATIDPLSIYRDRIAALPHDKQQRIQEFIDSVSSRYEEQVTN
ncbi:hypothetical protein [Paraburkholderia dipogonis]|uniref:hypothetical protein n=1 Tax=Paraburkholderia dipogonis TaxID=1211383 RepID=UPI0038B778BC